MKIIDDWLEDMLSQRFRSPFGALEDTEYSMLAGVLRAEAEAEGYRVQDLEDACGGNIARYLMLQQHAPVLEHVELR